MKDIKEDIVSVIKSWQYGNLCYEPSIDHLLQGVAEKMRHNWGIIQSIGFFIATAESFSNHRM